MRGTEGGLLQGCPALAQTFHSVDMRWKSVSLCVCVCAQLLVGCTHTHTHSKAATVPFGRRVRGICKFFAMSWKALWKSSFPFSFFPLLFTFCPLLAVSLFDLTAKLPNARNVNMSLASQTEGGSRRGEGRRWVRGEPTRLLIGAIRWAVIDLVSGFYLKYFD